MTKGNDNLDSIPDKKLLDTCVSAFEIAIREIRKIENGESVEPWNEPIMLDKSSLDAMKSKLVKYSRELYLTGGRNERERLFRSEDEIAREINKSISDIIESTVFSDSRK